MTTDILEYGLEGAGTILIWLLIHKIAELVEKVNYRFRVIKK